MTSEDRDRPASASTAIAACLGIAGWKQAAARSLLTRPGDAPPSFHRLAPEAVKFARARGGAVAVWPSREPRALAALAKSTGTPLARVEDGFLRSVGLGAHCRPPVSLVVDFAGVHFDPSRPSDLEILLTQRRFDAALVRRADRLLQRIVQLGLTKYNLRDPPAMLPDGRPRTVLVAGQVEDDLSVRLGGAGVPHNLELLRRVRALEPDAFILYKPHPDVQSGLRKGAWPQSQILRYANVIAADAGLPTLLEAVDAVHVLTSLTGFEALLRRREVVVHGQPFYAGWGLTRDLAPPPRRGRRLDLTELAAAALILYPRYLDPFDGRPCSPEETVERLASAPAASPSLRSGLRRLQGGAGRLVDALRCVA